MTLSFQILIAAVPVAALLMVTAFVLRRRAELRAYTKSAQARAEAKERGSYAARLQHPDIDLTKCIGCGACIEACPEEGVLDLLHGQAVVVHGARCVGHGKCAEVCPTAAIALTLADLDERRDIPALTPELEAVGTPGLFVAGELSGFALVRTAVAHGTQVADAVAARCQQGSPRSNGNSPAGAKLQAATAGGVATLEAPVAVAEPESATGDIPELLIVGAGPAGLACALRAKELGLRAVALDQAPEIGGTVATYPRRKLVMTQPMHLPLYGKLQRLSYQKEELVDLWRDVASEQQLDVRTGVKLESVSRGQDGIFELKTSAGVMHAHNVCLALGRRGSPRRLDVVGEGLPKVAYSLLDAASYQGRRVLIVGGGDSAIEAALALSRQPGNHVTLSYRRHGFFRIKAKNEHLLEEAKAEGTVDVVLSSQVVEIKPDAIRMTVGNLDAGEEIREVELPNDEVFIFAGGDPPFALLERAGVSFDPADRPAEPDDQERGAGLLEALLVALASAVFVLGWAVWHAEYYTLPVGQRAAAAAHAFLRSAGGAGLGFGLAAVVLIVSNLGYLVRRSKYGARWPGSLRLWMSMHLVTGLFALLAVLIHAGFTAERTIGGHAFLALIIVVCAGTVGRYLYAFVPRAANGSELDLDSVREQLAAMSSEWDRDARGFGTHVRETIEKLTASRWQRDLPRRILSVLFGQWVLSRTLRRLMHEGRVTGVSDDELRRINLLARRAHRLTLQVAHYGEVRSILASWRYIHRWLSLLMILLAGVHIFTAIRFANIDWSFSMSSEVGP